MRARQLHFCFSPNSGHAPRRSARLGPERMMSNRRSSSGSLAMFAAIRRASSRVSSLAADSTGPGSS